MPMIKATGMPMADGMGTPWTYVFVPMVIATGMPMTNSTGTPMLCVFCAHGNGHGHAHGLYHGRAYDYVHGHVYYWQTRSQDMKKPFE